MNCDSLFTIYIGDDVNQLCQVTMNNLPVDLTSAEAISCTILNDPSQTNPTQTFSVANSGIVVQNAVQGLFARVITAVQSAMFLAQNAVDLDFTVTNSSGLQQTYRFFAGLSVVARNT